MNQSTGIAEKIWNLFAASKPALRVQYRNNPAIKDKLPFFSPFLTAHSDRAGEYVDRYTEVAAAAKDEQEGLLNVLDSFTADLEKENPDLLYYSLECFLTNYQGEEKFVLPPLIVREPEMVLPTAPKGDLQVEVATGDPVETKMDWFREDPSLNEHHAHWHVVYNKKKKRDRQGEMFFYMHQQMIARYDADRIASGAQKVKAYDNMKTQFIHAGYAAGDDTRLSELEDFKERDPKQLVDPTAAEQQLDNLTKIRNDIQSGYYKFKHPQKPEEEVKAVNHLGSTIESNIQADGTRDYVNYHGDGHGVIGSLNNGVMYYPVAAIRDVIFWEWHKGIDNIYFQLQEMADPIDFSLNDPKITLRKMVKANNDPYSADLILCLAKDITGNAEEAGNAAFGGDNWEKDFAEGNFQGIKTTGTLHTYMKTASITYKLPDGTSNTYNYPYLTHDPFTYYIRVENKQVEAKLLTLRIFLAPADSLENRRAWIEMDKFTYTIKGNSKKVICRSDAASSVIKKPADGNPPQDNRNFDPVNIPIDGEQCSCGWPYRMLVPKGIEDGGGMNFTLMVMITDGTIDGLGVEKNCGSISFCGVSSGTYPDKLPLGFPFNRKFAGNGNAIRQFLTGNKNVICRSIKIKHHS